MSCYDHRIRTWAFFAPPDNMLYPLSLDGTSPGMSSTSKEMLATSLSSEPSHRRYRTQLAAQSSDLSPRSGIYASQKEDTSLHPNDVNWGHTYSTEPTYQDQGVKNLGQGSGERHSGQDAEHS